MIFKITGETPSKKNSRINTKSGKSFPNQRYAKWESEAVAQLMAQDRPAEPIDVPSKLTVNFYHADNVRRDSDNQLSSILDVLQDAGILADDRWQIVQAINVRNFKANSSWCEIAISKLKVENISLSV